LSNPYNNELLRQCYLLQMKRTFPQNNKFHQFWNYFTIEFKIPNLDESLIYNKYYIFTENKYINSYLMIGQDCLFFIIKTFL